MVIKDNRQDALGDFQSIIKSGFDINEILKSNNEQLKQQSQKKFETEVQQLYSDIKTTAKAKDNTEDKQEIEMKEVKEIDKGKDLIVAE